MSVQEWFLLSAALGEDSRLVGQLHRDLEIELRAQVGRLAGGILDGRRVAPGNEDAALAATAGSLPVMVALYSDRYFRDEWCGKEWAVFRARSGGPDRPAHPGLLAIVWNPPTRPLSRDLEEQLRQAVAGAPPDGYREAGLRSLASDYVSRVDRRSYWSVVESVVARIIEARADPPPPLPAGTISAIAPAFGEPSPDRARPPFSARGRPHRAPPTTRRGGQAAPRPKGPAPAARAAQVPRRRPPAVAVGYVGADQEWADWVEGLLRGRGHGVTQVRWNPARGDPLETAVGHLLGLEAGRFLVLLSRRYRPTDPSGLDNAADPGWNLLAGAARRDQVVLATIDEEPLPEPLRDAPSIDLSDCGPDHVKGLLTTIDSGGSEIRPESYDQTRRPGVVRTLGNTPHENDFFVGRDDELADIRSSLEKDGVVILAGQDDEPHMGEEEVAIEYSGRYRGRYGAVWWVPGSLADQLDAHLARLTALAADSVTAAPDLFAPPMAVPAAWWSPRLLVFTGVDSPEALLPRLPGLTADGSHVLVVAERTGPVADPRIRTLGPLKLSESRLLLREAAGLVAPVVTEDIARSVGNRPGLLAEVARYIRREQVDPELCPRLLTMVHRPAAMFRPTSGDGSPAGSGPGPAGPGLGFTGRDGSGGADGTRVSPAPPSSAAAPAVAQPAQPAQPARAERDRPSAPEPLPAPAGRAYIDARDVDSLVAELIHVQLINHPSDFGRWLADLRELTGRELDVPDGKLTARVAAVLEDAVSRPSPAILDAIVRLLESRDSADPAVERLGRIVDSVSERWGATDQAALTGVQLTVAGDPGSKMRADPEPPPFYFFTSYRTGGSEEHALRFHKKFQTELGARVKRSINHKGFFAPTSLRGGANWSAELQRALCTTPVMIALWSDDYFASEWCGREFAIFEERMRRATPPNGNPPTGIIPLSWLPLDDELPTRAARLQIPYMDLGQKYDKMPIMDLMRLHEDVFSQFLITLADLVKETARNPLPALDERDAEKISAAFGG